MDLKGFQPTMQELKLANGEMVHLSMNMGLIFRLQKENRRVYETVCRAVGNNKNDDTIAEGMDLLYAGYVCGCMAKKSEPMEEEEFLTLLPDDIGEFWAMMDLAWSLVRPKKKTPSGAPSNGVPASGKTG